MIPAPLSLWLGVLCCFVAVGLSATRLALAGLSGGTVRKIEIKNKALAERLDNWLNRRDELRLLLRLLLILDFLLLTFCLGSWDRHCVAQSGMLLPRLLPPVLGATFFFLATESLGRHMSSVSAGRFLSLTIPLTQGAGLLLFPLTGPITVWHRWARKWHESHAEEESRATAEDEIMSLVEQNEVDGNGDASLEADERRMIRGVFDLDETPVHEIMTPRVDLHAIENSAAVDDLKAHVVSYGHSRIPVYHQTVDHITGVVYAKDLLDDRKVAAAGTLADLCRHPVFIPETKNVGDLLAEFQQNSNHFAVVLDEYGGTAGIVTFEDILEEIVGEIRDEYDMDETEPAREMLPDGDLVVDARITIDELNRTLDLDLPEEDDFDTLGGYISSWAGRIPQVGEVLETEFLRLEVLSADPRRVIKARVSPKRDDALEEVS